MGNGQMISRRGLIGAALVLGAAGAGAVWWRGGDDAALVPGGPFTLEDGRGTTWSDTDFRGKFLLVYFGYTFCPDVCPTALGNLSSALDALPQAKLNQLQAVFISVDPKRDLNEDLQTYVGAFHPAILGLSGPMEEINRLAADYGARFEVHGDPASEDYSIDHTSIVYVMDPEGKFVTQFTHNASPQSMLAKLESVIK